MRVWADIDLRGAHVDDKDAVVATVKDYFEGWFDGDAERMECALHPALAKTGIGVDVAGVQVTESMGAEDMIGWTREGEGSQFRTVRGTRSPTNLPESSTWCMCGQV